MRLSAFRSRLFWQAFLSLALGLLLWLPVFYWLTVPYVDRLAYEVDAAASRAVLDGVAQTVRQSQRDLESWRQSALEAHRRELRNILLVVESWAGQLEAEVAAGRLERREARQQFLDKLRQFRYGNNDYLWAADYRSVLVSHPDPAMLNRDASGIRDVKGQLLVPAMVDEARRSGEGYLTYWWRRLDDGREARKLGYFRNLPGWQLVIGTGVYIDDIEAEVARRRSAMVDDLRRHLHAVKPAGSGDVFLIDGKLNAIVHPDPRIEGSNMAAVIDPGSGKPLGAEFVAAAARPDKTLLYQWKRPDDPEHPTDRKLAWIERIPESDWYVGASVFADDLGRGGDFLARRLALAFILGLVITALIALAFIRTVTQPILRLAAVARRHAAGDLSAVSDIERKDEIGVLAHAFNAMVARLRGQIEALEERVAQRTCELADWATRLEDLVAARTAEARAAEARFRGLVEQSLVGIMVVQDDGLRYVNPGLAQMHGYADPDEMLGFPPVLLVSPADRERLQTIDRRLVEGEIDSTRFELSAVRRDGSTFACEAHACRVEYEGRPAVIVLALEVDERRRAEMAREAALAAAENLSRLKSEFMGNMSHELRTPLNAVIGLAHIGQRATELAKAQNACGHIMESGRHLLRLVTDVLDFSRIDTGKFRLEPVDFDLFPLIEDVAAGSIRLAHAKGIDFELAIDLDRRQRYRGDAIRLAQVLNILLDNAVKFTDQGRVVLSVSREGGNLLFSVADTGIGMAPAELGRLFRPFEPLDGAFVRRHDGMGLSLALAERLIALMGGSLRAESRIGAGSTFRVRIPPAEAGEAAVPPPATCVEDRDFSI